MADGGRSMNIHARASVLRCDCDFRTRRVCVARTLVKRRLGGGAFYRCEIVNNSRITFAVD